MPAVLLAYETTRNKHDEESAHAHPTFRTPISEVRQQSTRENSSDRSGGKPDVSVKWAGVRFYRLNSAASEIKCEWMEKQQGVLRWQYCICLSFLPNRNVELDLTIHMYAASFASASKSAFPHLLLHIFSMAGQVWNKQRQNNQDTGAL